MSSLRPKHTSDHGARSVLQDAQKLDPPLAEVLLLCVGAAELLQQRIELDEPVDRYTTIRSDITYAWTRAGVVVCIGWAAKRRPLASREIPQIWQFPVLCQGAARQLVLHKTAKIVGLTGAAICVQI